MKRVIVAGVVTLAFVLALSSPADAKKKKHSHEHAAAIQKCKADYNAAIAAANANLKGKDLQREYKKLHAQRKQCIANAPK